jgi:NodT family efflux transporter outer membrane factor (OMF) lipoprotein
LPASFNGLATQDNSAQLSVEEFFNDPVLVRLIYQGLAGNQELKILEQNIQLAQTEVLLRRGAIFPRFSLRGGAALDRSSAFTPEGAAERQLFAPGPREFHDPLPDFLVAANVSWQVDIWRKLRNARDAASLRYLATADGRNYVVTRLVADIAENYYRLLALDQRLDTLNQTIAIQERSLEIAEARLKAGRDSELPVQRFRAEVRRNQGEKLVVGQEIIEAENRINFLLGRYPQKVERSSDRFFDLTLPTLAVGVPSQLLLNRPDIKQAEKELAAAGLEIKVARAEFFPQLDITGGVGYRAFNPKYLFEPEALVGNVAGDLVAPLVNKAAIRAVYQGANARQLQRVYEYQRTVLDAYTEVVNRVSMVENYRVSIEFRKQQLAALEASVDFSVKLFQAGRVEYVDVRLAQRDFLEAKVALIETKRQQLAAGVNAYQALGGGSNLWQYFLSCAPLPPEVPQPQIMPQLQPTPIPPAVPAPGIGLPLPQAVPDTAPPPRPVPAKPKLPEIPRLGMLPPAPHDDVEWARAAGAPPRAGE